MVHRRRRKICCSLQFIWCINYWSMYCLLSCKLSIHISSIFLQCFCYLWTNLHDLELTGFFVILLISVILDTQICWLVSRENAPRRTCCSLDHWRVNHSAKNCCFKQVWLSLLFSSYSLLFNLFRFREGKEKLLITTNLCARGIDVEQVHYKACLDSIVSLFLSPSLSFFLSLFLFPRLHW